MPTILIHVARKWNTHFNSRINNGSTLLHIVQLVGCIHWSFSMDHSIQELWSGFSTFLSFFYKLLLYVLSTVFLYIPVFCNFCMKLLHYIGRKVKNFVLLFVGQLAKGTISPTQVTRVLSPVLFLCFILNIPKSFSNSLWVKKC